VSRTNVAQLGLHLSWHCVLSEVAHGGAWLGGVEAIACRVKAALRLRDLRPRDLDPLPLLDRPLAQED
jgi:hypothetical protein